MKRALRSMVLKCPGCDAGISLASRVACASCLVPYHEECFLSTGECVIEGCSGRQVIERGGAPRGALPVPKRKPDRIAKLDYVSPREAVLGLVLIGLVCRYALPKLQLPRGASKWDTIWNAVWCLLPPALAAVWFKKVVLDDHWVIDPGERVILSRRRFLGWSSVTPFVAFDELVELRVTQTFIRDRRGELQLLMERYALVKRDGSTIDITGAVFEGPRSTSDPRPPHEMRGLAELLGVPLREITDPGSR